MPGALAVRVSFEDSRDAGAPAFPLILAINYPDLKAVENIINSVARAEATKATQEVLATYFTGHIHHHVMQANEYVL